jgi:hypothetical protein
MRHKHENGDISHCSQRSFLPSHRPAAVADADRPDGIRLAVRTPWIGIDKASASINGNFGQVTAQDEEEGSLAQEPPWPPAATAKERS